jgi:hypothetical protein
VVGQLKLKLKLKLIKGTKIMSTNESAVDKAMRLAGEAAANSANEPATEVETYQATNAGGVAVYQAPRRKTLEDLENSSTMNVDTFLKVNQFGLSVKDSEGLIDDIEVIIDMDRGVAVNECIKYGGNNAIYVKTFDGVTANTGKPWAAELAKIAQIEPKARPYPSADLTLTLAKDAIGKVKGQKEPQVILPAGKTLGHSTSTTNLGNLTSLIKDVKDAGLEGKKVRVEISSEERNKNNTTWGVLKFKLLGEAE